MGSARHIASRIARRSSACPAAATCPWHHALLAVLLCCLALLGCGGSSAQGAPFAPAQSIRDAVFVREAAIAQNDGYIDASHTSDGYVSASATSSSGSPDSASQPPMPSEDSWVHSGSTTTRPSASIAP